MRYLICFFSLVANENLQKSLLFQNFNFEFLFLAKKSYATESESSRSVRWRKSGSERGVGVVPTRSLTCPSQHKSLKKRLHQIWSISDDDDGRRGGEERGGCVVKEDWCRFSCRRWLWKAGTGNMLIASKNHRQRCGGGGSGSYSSGRRFWWSTVLLLTACLGVGISAWHGLVFSYPRRSIPPPCVLLPAAFGVQGSAPVASGLGASSSSSLSVPSLNLQPTAAVSVLVPSLHLIRSSSYNAGDLQLQQIVFGIAGASQLWEKRREFIKLWWRPKEMRGFVWLEEPPVKKMEEGENLPIVLVSEDTSGFRYTHPLGHPSGIRISRVVCESFRLHLPDVRWFVMGDDDTIFSAENLVRVLSKYDSREMWYIGSTSESHKQNDHFSHSMAYGGGGFAISYPLAEALAAMQDECLERYPQLFGSDDRLHACITELGVPLTREPGFHQVGTHVFLSSSFSLCLCLSHTAKL